MIKVYCTKVFPFLEEGTFFKQENKIEKTRWQSIQNAKNSNVKARTYTAGMLLHAGLCEYLGLSKEKTPPVQTVCGQWGKPYLTEYPGIYFNLSHSGQYVCCAVADHDVGVDIQCHQNVKDGIAKRFFTGEDNELLDSCKENGREELFFRIWCIRESYVKLTGRGLGQGLSSFQIEWKNRAILDQEECTAYFAENQEMKGYSLCVCSREKGASVKWIWGDI